MRLFETLHPRSARSALHAKLRVAVVILSGLACTLLMMPAANAAPANAGSSGPASISIPGVSGNPDGWITYTKPLASQLTLKDARTTTVAGERDAAGNCVIGYVSQPSRPGSLANYQEEVAFNPKTCQERVLSGLLTPADLSKLNALSSSSANSAGPAATISGTALPPKSARGVSPATTSYDQAYTKTAWIDPLDITITSLANNLSWPLYGAGGTISESAVSYDFPYDGWSSSGVTWPNGFQYTSGDGGGWYISAVDHFTNTDFATLVYAVFGLAGWLACGAPLTATAHFNHDVTTYGYMNGDRGSASDDTTSGACTDLVHHGSWSGYGSTS